MGLGDLPDLGNEKDNNDKISQIYRDAILRPDDEVEDPEFVFGIDDTKNGQVGIASKGNISMLKGAKKSRKTFATSAIAACVTGSVQQIKFLPYDGKKKLLYVDTEQSKTDCQKVNRRILEMTGLKVEEFNERFTFLFLRPYNGRTRKDVIEWAITQNGKNIDLVVIDGVRDLITDVNDSEESNQIVSDLMAWSTNYDLHILNILHENKSNQNARGHLGTELQNKCETVIRISKDEKVEDISIIEGQDTRGLGFDPIAFEINGDGIPVASEDYEIVEKGQAKSAAKSQTPQSVSDLIPDDVHYTAIREVYSNEQGMFDQIAPLSTREFNKRIQKALQKHDFDLKDSRIRKLVEFYLDRRMLIDLNEDNEVKVKKLIPGFDDDLPF